MDEHELEALRASTVSLIKSQDQYAVLLQVGVLWSRSCKVDAEGFEAQFLGSIRFVTPYFPKMRKAFIGTGPDWMACCRFGVWRK